MAITWTSMETKFQRWVRSANSDVLTQGQEDMNMAYHMFNAKLARYYTRKQQFADLKAGQGLYQTPIDSVRIMGMTVIVTTNYQPTVKEVRSEYEWRQLTSYQMQSNWPTWYYVLGNDLVSLWPIPSQTISAGLRYYYQPQDHDLSVEDITSATTSQTVSINNGANTVTATGTPFTTQMVGLSFQLTGVTDLSWYEIAAVPTNSTLTLKSNFVGVTTTTAQWRIGQLSIIPQEYSDAPIHYAASTFFSANGNEVRAQEHLNLFQAAMVDCEEEYSSSNQSSVITDDDLMLNPWLVPPPAG